MLGLFFSFCHEHFRLDEKNSSASRNLKHLKSLKMPKCENLTQKRTAKNCFGYDLWTKKHCTKRGVLQAKKGKRSRLDARFHPRTWLRRWSHRETFYFAIFCSFASLSDCFSENFYDAHISISENSKVMYAYCSNLFRCWHSTPSCLGGCRGLVVDGELSYFFFDAKENYLLDDVALPWNDAKFMIAVEHRRKRVA